MRDDNYLKDKKEEIVDVIPPDDDVSAITQLIIDNTNVIGTFQMDSTTMIADGIAHTHIRYLNQQELPMSIHVLEVDLSNGNLVAYAMSPYNDRLYGFQRISEMARDNEKTGTKIMAAINADYYNTSTGEPTGTFIINGLQRKINTSATRPYFAIMQDGTAVIGRAPVAGQGEEINLNAVEHLVSGNEWLVFEGESVNYSNYSIEPRTAIGLTQDQRVYVVIVDGRQQYFSNGCGMEELRQMMLAFGTYHAFNLDGGASSTLAIRIEPSRVGTGWAVKNRPSDGVERAVANGLAFAVVE